MYLAEDRILCFELVAKANSSWLLRYVKSAIGETDVPDALPEFISQRRRWLNGSFFAATYAIAHAGQIWRSGHTTGRKLVLMAETVYNVVNLVASWFALGNFYLFFVILTSSLESEIHVKFIKYLNAFIQYVMAGLVIAAFLLSMGNKPKASKWKYKILTIVFAVFMVYMIFCAVMATLQAVSIGGGANRIMIFSLLATYGVYMSSSFLAFDPWHMFTSFIPYMLLSPMYVNILNVYAFCNLDDISWGTKQDTTPDTDLGAVVQSSDSQVDVEVHADSGNDMYDLALGALRASQSQLNVARAQPQPQAQTAKGAAAKASKQVSNPTPNPRAQRAGARAEREKARTLSTAEREQAAKDYYASVRTNVLLAWVLSNGVLLAAVLGGGDPTAAFNVDDTLTRTKAYMTFVLAFVGLTSVVRFAGATMYLVARVFTG